MTRPNITQAVMALHDGYNDRIISKEMRDLLVRVVEGLGKPEMQKNIDDKMADASRKAKGAFAEGFFGKSETSGFPQEIKEWRDWCEKSKQRTQETPKEGRNPYKCSDCGMALLSPRPALDLDEKDERKIAGIVRVYSGWDIGEESCWRISGEIIKYLKEKLNEIQSY